MTDEPKHGEPGHECHVLDATAALGGVIISQSPDDPATFTVDAWARAVSKREMAKYLRIVADSWDEDADAEDRAATAGLN